MEKIKGFHVSRKLIWISSVALAVLASIPKLFVAATQPNINGMAPGKAPTKTESGVTAFKGV